MSRTQNRKDVKDVTKMYYSPEDQIYFPLLNEFAKVEIAQENG
jgi:hypothetical protein